jgi:hypothetical protein
MAHKDQFESLHLLSAAVFFVAREVTHALYFKRLRRDLDSMLCPALQG